MIVIEHAPDMARFAYQGYHNNGTEGPVSITRATMGAGGERTDVYIVGLSGTDAARYNDDGQSVGWITNLLIGIGVSGYFNDYTAGAKEAMRETIPAGATVIFAGHSLGGMVAQQLAADPWVKSTYNVDHTVTFGSPKIAVGLREGEVQRLGATGDPVPLLSVASFILPGGLNIEDSGYINPLDAHVKSYLEVGTWGAYDAKGYERGGTIFTYDERDVSFHRIPALIPRASAESDTAISQEAQFHELVARVQSLPPEHHAAIVREANALVGSSEQTPGARPAGESPAGVEEAVTRAASTAVPSLG